LSSVVGGRFVTHVELDNGGLTVDPAGTTRPRVTARIALTMFHAAQVVQGEYRFAILGLGLATISPQLTAPTTTGPGSSTTTSGPGTSTSTSTTTTTTMTTTTTSSSTGTPTSTTTTTGTPTSTTTPTAPAPPALPRYERRLAWVGIAWGADCPARPGGSRLATRYVAVVFDATTGHSVLAYTSRSALACSGPVQPASVSRPTELVSVPWQPVGPASTAVRVTMAPCSTYYGWTDVSTTGNAAVQVVALEPFDPGCASKTPPVQIVDSVVPVGAAQTQVSHAALGPVDGLRTLAPG